MQRRATGRMAGSRRVTGDAGPASSPDPGGRTRRDVVGSVIRTTLVLAVLLCAYGFAPLDHRPAGTVGVQLALWLLVSFTVIGFQILAVTRSPYPRLRAIEGIAVSVPLFVLLFSSAYFIIGRVDPAGFNEPLSKLDTVYFTTTIFATVGFGDIVARSEAARTVVTLQMFSDLLLIGLIAKVLYGAVQQRRRDLDNVTSEPPRRVAGGSSDGRA